MKREIIFRGKRLDNGKWEYGDLVHDDIGGMYVFPNDAENLYIEYRVDPDTVGQYTGVVDPNGKRVFEGDVIGYTNPDTNITKTFGVVRWHREGNFYIDTYSTFNYDSGQTASNVGYMIPSHDTLTIIGNVYDNPELLKQSAI